MAAILLRVLVLLVALSCLMADFSSAYYIESANDGMINMDRSKRYTDSQDRASAYCTGMCMYDQKKPYSDCYDLCNWNGRGPSPWAKLEAAEKSSGPSGAPVNNLQALMRTGAGGGKMRATKPRRKNKDKAPWESRR